MKFNAELHVVISNRLRNVVADLELRDVASLRKQVADCAANVGKAGVAELKVDGNLRAAPMSGDLNTDEYQVPAMISWLTSVGLKVWVSLICD